MSTKRKIALRKQAHALPVKPGIYFFKDSAGRVVYIGKARSLRNRVKSYFTAAVDPKVEHILAETADIDFILTGSAREAAFLENNFIRQHQPKFNLRLKDDKSFPYLKVTFPEDYPGIFLTRRVEPDGARYFGPFSPANQARKAIHLINKYFGVRSCTEKIPGRRKRPCLDYDLGLCVAPCVGFVAKPEYKERVNNALLFLEGKTEELLKILKAKMHAAADRQDYEQAAHWRDLVLTLDQVHIKPKLISVQAEDQDIFGFARQGENAAVYVFIMRKGRVLESETSLARIKANQPESEILAAEILRFYQKRPDVPGKILLPFPPAPRTEVEDELSARRKAKVKMHVPQRGKSKTLVDLASRNAAVLFEKPFEGPPALDELAEALGLDALPERIEGIDISNTGGLESVGALVLFEKGEPLKDGYRRFRIASVEGPNDVASLAEVIRRRYTRLKEEGGLLPDLILVDGGKGQLSAAQKALREVGMSQIPVVSLAKKEELLFTSSRKDGLRLDRTSPALKLLQRIRDEAHRFAITLHRHRREKRSFASLLDSIPGIGEKKKQRLWSRYKSFEEIRQAPEEELAKLIGRKAALSVLEKLAKPTDHQDRNE